MAWFTVSKAYSDLRTGKLFMRMAWFTVSKAYSDLRTGQLFMRITHGLLYQKLIQI